MAIDLTSGDTVDVCSRLDFHQRRHHHDERCRRRGRGDRDPGGRILAVGTAAPTCCGPKDRARAMIDLAGRTLLPGFLDGHSHFINSVRMATWANVSAPPVGPVTRHRRSDRDACEETRNDRAWGRGEWLFAYGYDGTAIRDGRELDARRSRPAFSRQSRRADARVAARRSAQHGGLRRPSSFDLFAPTPAGGMTVRKPGTNEAAGLVMEHSFLPIFMNMPAPTEQEQLDAFDRGAGALRQQRLHHAQDAPMEPATRPLYHKAAEQGRLFHRLRRLS